MTNLRKPFKMLRPVNLLYAALLLLLLVTVTGCATSSPQSAPVCPTLPPPPALTMPTASPSYSANASTNIKRWRSMLTDSPATGKH